MSTQVKPIAQQGKQEKQEQGKQEQVQEREKQKDQEVLREKSVPDVEVKQVRKDEPREVSAGVLKEKEPEVDLRGEPIIPVATPYPHTAERGPLHSERLMEGRIVHYLTPNTWRPNARGQVRAALVLFCYRDAEGKPTGTCNLCIFLNGPMDTGDMGGAKTRCTQFEPGVKFGGAGEPEPGTWSWPARS